MMAVAAALVLVLAGCGGGTQSGDPVDQVPQANGLRDKVATAQAPKPADFPATKGRTLQQVADGIGGGRIQAALASSPSGRTGSPSASSTTRASSSTARPRSTSRPSRTSRPRAPSSRLPTCC
jgi:hypothetical protein